MHLRYLNETALCGVRAFPFAFTPVATECIDCTSTLESWRHFIPDDQDAPLCQANNTTPTTDTLCYYCQKQIRVRAQIGDPVTGVWAC